MKKILLILSLVFWLGCDLIGWDVEYKVSGSGGSFDVTISNEDDGSSQFDNVNSGWSYSFHTDDSDHFLYISAQNQNSSGSVTTKIYVGGKKKKSSTSEGAYVIASCSMSAGD
jgi:hypothetical protein